MWEADTTAVIYSWRPSNKCAIIFASNDLWTAENISYEYKFMEDDAQNKIDSTNRFYSKLIMFQIDW